jgi:hypothetical protein
MEIVKTSSELEELYGGQKSQLILVLGEPSRGKTTSLRTLNPDTTHIINVMGKWFPFPKGFQYKLGKNLTLEKDALKIMRKMQDISTKEPHVTDLIIDDAHYIMATEFVNKALEKGYDKFSIMAKNMMGILTTAADLRSTLRVYFLCHEDESATGKRKMKTQGKMLDQHISPDGLSTIILFAEILIRDNKPNAYVFKTQSDGYTTARSPMGMFPETIPNDMLLVSKRIDEYYGGVELKGSKLNFSID